VWNRGFKPKSGNAVTMPWKALSEALAALARSLVTARPDNALREGVGIEPGVGARPLCVKTRANAH
jgi:hypothetical protein